VRADIPVGQPADEERAIARRPGPGEGRPPSEGTKFQEATRPRPCLPQSGFYHARTPIAVASRFHARRAAGGDRHHRHPRRPSLARRPEGARRGRTDPVHQQPAPAWPGSAQLPRRLQAVPARVRRGLDCLFAAAHQRHGLSVPLPGGGKSLPPDRVPDTAFRCDGGAQVLGARALTARSRSRHRVPG
jgi:hypothetical protein